MEKNFKKGLNTDDKTSVTHGKYRDAANIPMIPKMTDKELWQKIFDKAVKSGWKGYSIGGEDKVTSATVIDAKEGERLQVSITYIFENETGIFLDTIPILMVIYEHSFAKAFWGEKKIDSEDLNVDGQCWVCSYDALIFESGIKKWQRHLQQIVLEENKIKYLSKFL